MLTYVNDDLEYEILENMCTLLTWYRLNYTLLTLEDFMGLKKPSITFAGIRRSHRLVFYKVGRALRTLYEDKEKQCYTTI